MVEHGLKCLDRLLQTGLLGRQVDVGVLKEQFGLFALDVGKVFWDGNGVLFGERVERLAQIGLDIAVPVLFFVGLALFLCLFDLIGPVTERAVPFCRERQDFSGMKGHVSCLVYTEMTRRQVFATVSALLLPTTTKAAGFHITGTLTASVLEEQEGYFTLCGSKACEPREGLTIAVHPNNAVLYPQLVGMLGQEVQVSVFR